MAAEPGPARPAGRAGLTGTATFSSYTTRRDATAASIKGPSDLAPLIDILYYHDKEGEPPPGEPYYSGLTYLDVTNNNCDWTMEDIQALAEHVASDRGQAWLRAQFDEMAELIRTVKAPLPESLRGVFD